MTAALRRLLRDDSMSIALFALFAACIAAQSVTGWLSFDQSLREGHLPTISWAAYLRTGDFLDGAFSNWQAALLQLAVLVAFGSVLHQKGAAHSKKLAQENPEALNPRTLSWKFARRESLGAWVYANSLSLAFIAAFAASLLIHVGAGTLRHNEEQRLRHLPPESMGAYAGSAEFWVSLFQTWEAEFFAIALYVVLSIFLRQEHSPESKPVGSSNADTGDTNH